MHEIRSDIPFLFRTRCWLLVEKMILLSSFAWGLKSVLIYWYFYLLPHGVRSWSLNDDLLTLLDLHLIVKLGFVPVLHLKANQTWFCFGLTLENQSNLVLFWSYTWKPVKLSAQIFSYAYLLGLILDCQFGCVSTLSRISTWSNLQLWCQSNRF